MNPEMVLATKISIFAVRTHAVATHFTLTQETPFNFDVFHDDSDELRTNVFVPIKKYFYLF